ncbi:DNA-3-methyladenine glycosylase family protein [Paenibacillus turpanensis]|uniref:DNA-3-methyladenine glycosylase family protein n=1 Tax=Paenibacillus turpanensis TaxID=2689078 RepID=UPI00140BCF9E|nr:DNA-3-methyladenine glycosylase [Paenibacillus turpanensis]
MLPAGITLSEDGRYEITAADFNFEECLFYLSRNANEVLHEADREQAIIRKAVRDTDGSLVLLQLEKGKNGRPVLSFPIEEPEVPARQAALGTAVEWLDLSTDLQPFYRMAAQDPILGQVVPSYQGLRIVGVPDLFEALCWAIMGQQVSLHVAYLVKKKFVETFGEAVCFQNKSYWVFPSAAAIAELSKEQLTEVKLTQRKAEYILGVAKLMAEGGLTKSALQQQPDLASMEKQLTAIRGIGSWTANYAIMRCLRHPDAFPLADVGLHNALKHVLRLDRKPALSEIEEWAARWSGWKAYATFYLWRTITT